ncbi:MAG: RNA polymerase factor sigma-54 [Alphaproteobacteria bacterium]|nr:RNA polymerase factor sigma-54 [Alphaproteobacteria bacterium]
MSYSQSLAPQQAHGLAMTPRLQQAIRMLQFSHADLLAYVEQEIEKNPLLQKTDGENTLSSSFDESSTILGERIESDQGIKTNLHDSQPSGHLSGQNQDSFQDYLEKTLDLKENTSLHTHLKQQASLTFKDPFQRKLAYHLIERINETGYLEDDLDDMAGQIDVIQDDLEAVLLLLQDLDPPGVAARNLAECLSLQLRDKNRLNPAMKGLLGNLELFAKGKFETLKRICCVNDEELTGMIAEIRSLDPKPGLRFSYSTTLCIIPDVLVSMGPDGDWLVELNSKTLPRLLVDKSYHATLTSGIRKNADKNYLDTCLKNASWLVKNLNQRANTILKVTTEIIRQQRAFINYGVSYLRPLNLKTIADAVSVHESTVSRVTLNKFIATPRGTFEVKYFFTTAVPGTIEGHSHSATAVRQFIKEFITKEDPNKGLPDEEIVNLLRARGINIARRTVAKYRLSLRIPSLAQRRRYTHFQKSHSRLPVAEQKVSPFAPLPQREATQ